MRLSDGRVRKRRSSRDHPHHAHELTFTCYQGRKFLSRDRSREWFVAAIERARNKLGFEVWAYVIMPNHAHLLVWPGEFGPSVSSILHAIKQPVAIRAIRWLRATAPDRLRPLRHTSPNGKVQHRFWEIGGGYDRNMWTGDAGWNAVGYIHRNPVRAKLAGKPTDWKWSRASWYAGVRDVPLLMDRKPPMLRKSWFPAGSTSTGLQSETSATQQL